MLGARRQLHARIHRPRLRRVADVEMRGGYVMTTKQQFARDIEALHAEAAGVMHVHFINVDTFPDLLMAAMGGNTEAGLVMQILAKGIAHVGEASRTKR